MRLFLLGLTILLVHTVGAQAQSGIRTYDFPAPLQTDRYAPGDVLVLDLRHPDLLYSGTESFRLFAPDNLPNPLELECALADCPKTQDSASLQDGILPETISLQPTAESPLVLRVNQALQPGDYIVQVIGADQQILHKRRLRVIPPPPQLDEVIFIDADGKESASLELEPNRDLQCRIVLRGQNLRPGYQASIQGLPLEYQGDAGEEFYYQANWRSAQLDTLDYEHPKLRLYKPEWGSLEKEITLRGQQPSLEHIGLLRVRPGQLELPLKLAGAHLYRRAEVCVLPLEGSPRVLADYTCIDRTRLEQGRLSVSLTLDLPKGFSAGGFRLKVRNRDGQESAEQIIRLKVVETTAQAQPYIAGRPLLEGLPAVIKFEASSASHPFPAELDKMELHINRRKVEMKLREELSSESSFVAELTLPEGLGGTSPAFRLRNNGHMWTGFFEPILPLPGYQLTPDTLRPGGELRLSVFPKIPELRLSSDDAGVRMLDADLSDGEGRLELRRHMQAREIQLRMLLHDQPVRSFQLPIRPYPAPKESIYIRYEDGPRELSSELLDFAQHKPITIQAKDSSRQMELSVQLYKKDGTKLGEKQYIRAGEPTQLRPQNYGLAGGDEFFIAFDTPDREPVTQRAYLRREGIERWVINVGISAAEITLTKPEEGLKEGSLQQAPRTTLLDGLNLGVFYLPELHKRQSARPVGVGMNFILQKNAFNERIDGRIALSTLLYEKIVLGLSFGQQRTALFLGANLNITSFGKIFAN